MDCERDYMLGDELTIAIPAIIVVVKVLVGATLVPNLVLIHVIMILKEDLILLRPHPEPQQNLSFVIKVTLVGVTLVGVTLVGVTIVVVALVGMTDYFNIHLNCPCCMLHRNQDRLFFYTIFF